MQLSRGLGRCAKLESLCVTLVPYQIRYSPLLMYEYRWPPLDVGRRCFFCCDTRHAGALRGSQSEVSEATDPVKVDVSR
jgi:hypothetical protein